MFSPEIEALARAVVEKAKASGLYVTTAESCTGGLTGGAITEIAGSSAVFGQGFITYSNVAKAAALGVDKAVLKQHGAVSEPTARAMAQGAVAVSGADVGVAITGVAGPGGGSSDKPVGTVHFASHRKGGETTHFMASYGDIGRGQVREASVSQALRMLLDAMGK